MIADYRDAVPRADSPHGQGDRRRRGCGRAVVRGPAAGGRAPGRRGRPGPAAGDDVGGRGGALVPLPRLPVRAGRPRWSRGHLRARSTTLAGVDGTGVRMLAGTELHRSRQADPWWRDAVPALTRVTALRAAVRRRLDLRGPGRRDAGLPALAGRPGRGARRHADPDGAHRAAGPRRGGRQRDRPRRPADGRRPVAAARCAARSCTSSRSAWTGGGSTGADGGPVYVVPRSRDIVVGGTDDEGEWDRRPDPDVAKRILERAVELVPALARARVLRPPGRAAARAPRRTAGGRGRRRAAGRALLRPRRRGRHAVLGLRRRGRAGRLGRPTDGLEPARTSTTAAEVQRPVDVREGLVGAGELLAAPRRGEPVGVDLQQHARLGDVGEPNAPDALDLVRLGAVDEALLLQAAAARRGRVAARLAGPPPRPRGW